MCLCVCVCASALGVLQIGYPSIHTHQKQLTPLGRHDLSKSEVAYTEELWSEGPGLNPQLHRSPPLLGPVCDPLRIHTY